MPEPSKERKPGDQKRVMVVHGRNMNARNAMFDFLRAVNLSPIEWEEAVAEAGGGSPYTGHVVQKAIEGAAAVIVLLTGDDLAVLRPQYLKDDDGDDERNSTPQARPNVIIELGMALMANENKTIIVQFDRTRGISDTWGRNALVYKASDDQGFRDKLVRRLATPIGKIEPTESWLRSGDFASAVTAPPARTTNGVRTTRAAKITTTDAKKALHLAANRLEETEPTANRFRLLRIDEVDDDNRVYASAGRNDTFPDRLFPELEEQMGKILGVPIGLRFRRDLLRP